MSVGDALALAIIGVYFCVACVKTIDFLWRLF